MPHSIPIRRRELLKGRLDQLVATFDVSTISPDPLELVLRHDDPLDQEVAGLIAAAFAYGRADIVVANAGALLAKMTPSPHRYLAEVFTPAEARRRFAGFSHRFQKTPELVALLESLAGAIRTHGSLSALFASGYDETAPIDASLARFIASLRAGSTGRVEPRALAYLLPSPDDGSACKRMNLFLRWMVRRETPDLGLWRFVDPSKLVIPLDTHVHRIALFLGLTKRRSAGWITAREVTASLAKLDSADPVRYDFAICRLGILDKCSRRRKKENCDVCLLRDVCRFPVK